MVVGVFDEAASQTAAVGFDVNGEPMTVDRPFPTASLAKVFTATAVMQLVDDDVIELDAPVADYVEFPVATGTTVRHLLQHTSAIPDTSSHIGRCTDESTINKIEDLAGAGEEGRGPGGVSSYSNTNYLRSGS